VNLVELQSRLKVGKTRLNSFSASKYYYRSCEDILEAVKPLLKELGMALTLSDDIVEVGGRVYVKATATLSNEEGYVSQSTAFAREPEMKKGMDESQITGCASSYARKYALNGLLAIDDTRDADTMDNREAEKPIITPEKDAVDYEARVIASDLPDDVKAKVIKALPTYTAKTLEELDSKLKSRGF
jgi:hypothetical protein